jgi:hypothetical protein
MLLAFRDRPGRKLGNSVAISPHFRAPALFQQTTPVRALPARETGTSTGSPASVAAEPRPYGAYSREETYRKERA